MTQLPEGTEVAYTVTYLSMGERPGWDAPAMPKGVVLERAEMPPVWYFLALYGAVGRDYEWTDKFDEAEADLAAFVQHPDVSLYTALAKGWPQGFFILDWREPGTCDLAYFGLVPEAIGGGIGKALLKTAIAWGWQRSGIAKMTVNTCTLDHPRALGLYRSMGFVPERLEEHTRILARPRDLSTHPFAEPANV